MCLQEFKISEGKDQFYSPYVSCSLHLIKYSIVVC